MFWVFLFFFFFWHSAALKRVTEKQNQILLEKELQSGKIKNEILKEVERKELKCSIEAERRRSTGKKLDKNNDVFLITN